MKGTLKLQVQVLVFSLYKPDFILFQSLRDNDISRVSFKGAGVLVKMDNNFLFLDIELCTLSQMNMSVDRVMCLYWGTRGHELTSDEFPPVMTFIWGVCHKKSVFTSRVSVPGHRIGAVCASVHLSALSSLNRLTYDLDLCASLNP